MNLKKVSTYLTAIVLALSFTACSDDDSSSDDNGNPDLGNASLTVNGDVEGQKSGMADFNYLEDLPGGMEEWEISIHDYNPQTFSLTLMLTSVNGVSQPEPGTYDIGFDANNPSVFMAIYTHIENEDFMNSVEYNTLFDGGGILTINSSTSETVTGTLEFTAHEFNDDFEIVGTITVSGEFTANKRVTTGG